MNIVLWLKQFLEYLGGEADSPPGGIRLNFGSPWWGLWWGFLLAVILIFCGQSSKFIYIDF